MEKIKDIFYASVLLLGFLLLLVLLMFIPIVGWVIALCLIAEAFSASASKRKAVEAPLYVPGEWTREWQARKDR